MQKMYTTGLTTTSVSQEVEDQIWKPVYKACSSSKLCAMPVCLQITTQSDISFSFTMSIPRFSAILATRKCKTSNTQEDSFANITANVQTYLDDKDKEGRKKSVFIEEGLAWNKSAWPETIQ